MKLLSDSQLLKLINENTQVIIEKSVAILKDPKAKNTEVLNAADKLFKYKFALADSIKKAALDRIKLETDQITLEHKRLLLLKLKREVDPENNPTAGSTNHGMTDNGKVAASRVFSSQFKPEGVDDTVSRTG